MNTYSRHVCYDDGWYFGLVKNDARTELQ